ncbi:MAG TPA: hypothetical protein VEB65_01780 [Solirubrobacterales bacterium]|nr:hypothetical protein [Solirubrobacterales bacterium]
MLALTNPVLQREEREPLPGVVALVVDESASQRLGDRTAQTEAAVAALKERLQALGGFEVREVHATERPEGDGTALFSELTGLVDDVPPEQMAGAIFVTDGIVADVPADAASLGFNAPLHALITGAEGEHDRRIVLDRAPRFAILDEPQSLGYRVLDSDLPPGTQVRVQLRVDGTEVATDLVSVGDNHTIELPLDHAGRTIVELEVEAAENELALENNVAVAEMDVVREHLRVLLVSGEPHAGERTWRNVLKSDAAVDLVHFTILRPPEKQDGTPINELSLIAFPTRELFEEKIEEFDLIIFDRYQSRGVLPILYYDNLATYVRNGGAVLVAAGPDYAAGGSLYRTPLGPVLPAVPTGEIVEEPYRAQISPVGARHPVTRDLPGSKASPPDWSPWFRLVEADAIAGDVAMTGPGDRPLLVLAREGEGRVAMLLSDHAWLWARGYDGGGPHAALLRRLLHWLMREPELEEEALTAHAEGDDLVVERQTLAERAPEVSVTGPAGNTESLTLTEAEPGLWRGVVEEAALGLHRAEDGDLTVLAHMGPANPAEFQDVISTTERLAPIAEATGGSVRRIGDGAGISLPRISAVSSRAPASGRDWLGLRRSEATVLKSVDQLPLLGGLLGLALLVGSFAALWYREAR